MKELEENRWPIKKICGHNGELSAETPLCVEWEDCIWNPKDIEINTIMDGLIIEYRENLKEVKNYMHNGVKMRIASWKQSAIHIQDMHGDANQSKMRSYCRQNGLLFSLAYLYMT